MLHDVIYSLLVLTVKLAFFKKQLSGFIISLKTETPAQIFFYEFCEIFRNTFSIEHLQVTTFDSSGHYLKIYADILKTSK